MHGKILIVDPIAINRIVLKVKLSAAYYTVIQATSIAEARTALERSQPDVVISSAQFLDGTASDFATTPRPATYLSSQSSVAMIKTPVLNYWVQELTPF
jgi:two-component system cell cycle response regulator